MKTIMKSTTLVILAMGLLIFSAYGENAVTRAETSKQPGTVEALPKLLDLGAYKCIPCQMMAPILEDLTKTYKGVFEVEFVDVWQPENKERAIKHNISSIPTQIFFDAEGKELWRHVGYISKEDILGKWQELGFIFKTANGADPADPTK